MTLIDLHDAVDGFNELIEEEREFQMKVARLMSYYSVAPHVNKKAGIRRPEDLFELESDKEARRERIKQMKPIVVTKIYHAEQSNG